MPINPLLLLELNKYVDTESIELFGKFVKAARAAPSPNDFVKRALKMALGMENWVVVEQKVGK